MNAKNNFKMTKKGIIFLFASLISALSFNVEAQDRCLNVCPEQGALINVSGEDPSAVNGVICIDNLTGDNFVIQNGAELGNLPQALYTCYTVAVSNTSGANFDIASATYTVNNVQAELDMALMGTDECGSVSSTAKTFDINSSYCNPGVGATCMLNLCLCNSESTDFIFEYIPSGDTGVELFIVVDDGGTVVSLSPVSPISAVGLAQGNYQIYAVIYDPAKSGNLPTLLTVGSSLIDIQNELSDTACGSISAGVNASVNADACGCESIGNPDVCVTEVCECNGEVNEIKLSTEGYTVDGNNQQWYIVVSGGTIVTSQQSAADGSVSFTDLPDGAHQIYAVNYDPVANTNVATALANGNVWTDFTTGVSNGTYCASHTGAKDIFINNACDCPGEVDIEISDPCSCSSTGNIDLDGDGNIDLVDDVITITAPPSDSWCITNISTPPVLDNTGSPLSNGTCATEVNPGIYELTVYHPADGTGYGDVSFESASGSGSVLIANLIGCNCAADCVANEGSVSSDGTAYCDDEDTSVNITVSGNENGSDYSTIVLITTDNPLTSDIYDIVGVAEASPGMYNLGTGSTASFNVLGLDPGDYCIHSYNFLTSDFNPTNELQILNAAAGNITSIDALLALSGTGGNLPICGSVTSTACDAFTVHPEIAFNASIVCDDADLFNYSIVVNSIAGGSGGATTIEISDGTTAYNQGDAIPNDTNVTITVSDGTCSTSAELSGNCEDVDCPVSATADASNQAACGGSTIALSVVNVIGESGLSSSDYSVSWSSSDASIDVSNANSVSLSNTSCLAEEVTFTATLTCINGSGNITADVNVTVYPNEVQSFITSSGEGSCDPRVSVEDPCGDVIFTGTRTPSNIAPDETGDAVWNYIYLFQGNNTPAIGACALSGSFLVPYQCAPVCPTAVQFAIGDVEVCSGSVVSLPNLEDAISTLNVTGNLYADYSWTSSDGFSSDSGEAQDVALTNEDCAPKEVVFTYEITCALDGSVVRTGDFTATVYPTDISSFVEVEGEGSCIVSLTPIASCGLYITGDSFVAQEGESGTTTLSVTYVLGGCDATYSADVSYECAAPITCDAGTITGGAISFVCDGEFAIASTSGSDGFLSYVLHDGNDTGIGTVYATSFTGVFTNDGTLPVNVELCISAVAGSDQAADGTPDPNGECYDISECSQVVFITPMEVDFTQSCDETTGMVEVSYTITGGAPEYLPEVNSYDVAGTGGHTNMGSSGESYVLGTFEPGAAVSISVNDDGKGCGLEAVEDIVIPCEIVVTCDAGSVGSGAINFVCDGEFAVFSAVGASGNIAYVLHDGDNAAIGTVYSTSTTGVFVNDGTLPTNQELCVSSVAGSDVDAAGIPDPDGACYDISECAPVVFLTPVTVEVIQECDVTTGLVAISYTITGGAPEYLPSVHTYAISGPAGYTNDGASGETYAYGDVSANQDFSFSIDDDGKGCSSGFEFTSIDCNEIGPVANPAITIDKIADASGVTDPAVAGQVINYSFTVCNTGDVDLTDVSVADDLVTVSGGPISLAVGECDDATFTASYTITDADITAGEVVNSATTSGTYTDANGMETVVNDNDIETVPLEEDIFVAMPAISLDKIADASGITDPAVAGQVINYSFTVCNTGNVDLTDVSIDDNLVTVSGGPTSLAVGECDETTFTASYTITAEDIASGSVDNSATVSGTYTDPNGMETVVDDTDEVTVPLEEDTFVAAPSISLDKIADASGVSSPAVAGQVITYNFTVCNTGNVDLTDVSIDDNLVSVSGGPISLAVGECDATTFTASYSITNTDIASGLVDNSATVSGTYTAPNGTETIVSDADTATVPLTAPAECNNDAGVMPSAALNICNGTFANAPTTGATIDAGSVLTYVLHNGEGSSLGTTIDFNSTGLFLNDGSYPTGIQLYICAVVSPSTGDFPNVNADCTSISNCTPVTFLSQVNVDVEVDCTQSGNYTVVFEISGGLPASQVGGLYSVSGDFTGLVAPNTPTSAGPFNAGTFYTLNISDNNGCGANVVSQEILCEKLPIELISFTGETQAQGNMLKWVTASETENDFFTLERSTDGINFELINTQKGAGTTGDINSYTYLDREAPNGISYYKLWQTDLDGTLNYVDIVALTRGEASLAINSLLPIPVLEFLELTYTSVSESQVELQIYDALGKQLGSKSVGANVGLNIENLDVSVYPPGMYFLTIHQGDVTITEKFIKE